MKGPSQSRSVVHFGVFHVDLRAGELSKNGVKVRLQEQPFQILALLLEHAGEVVSREELRQRLWPGDTFVDFDHSLGTAINKIREALGDSADNPRFVETLARRGYRFIAPVSLEPEAAPAATTHAPLLRTRWFVLALAVVLSGTVYFAWHGFRQHLNRPIGKIMLAVLPFDNLSGDPEQEYFSDGMTEEMIAQLGGLDPQRLGVIARATAMQYKRTNKAAKQIGQELSVDYILEGSVRREGGRARVTAQLIQVGDQTHLWAQSYERDLRDMLALQNEVAQAIAREIEVKLTAQQQARLSSSHPVNSEAQEAYLRGLYFWNKTTEQGLEKAVEYFQTAVENDPNYAAPYAGLADSYLLLGDYGFLAPEKAYPKAKAEALRALEKDDHLAEAHAALAMVAFEYGWDWADAEKEFRRAIEINQNYATAHQWYAEHLTTLGRYEEAIGQVNRARELDPLSLSINATAGLCLYYAQRYDRAIEQSKKTIEMDPSFWMPHWVLGRVYNRQEFYGKAIPELQIAAALPGPRTFALSELGYAYARSGRTAEARRILQTLEGQARSPHHPGLDLAIIYLGLGEHDQALAWLEAGYNQHSMYMIWLKVEPTLQPLHSDPRFANLVRRVGLPQ